MKQRLFKRIGILFLSVALLGTLFSGGLTPLAAIRGTFTGFSQGQGTVEDNTDGSHRITFNAGYTAVTSTYKIDLTKGFRWNYEDAQFGLHLKFKQTKDAEPTPFQMTWLLNETEVATDLLFYPNGSAIGVGSRNNYTGLNFSVGDSAAASIEMVFRREEISGAVYYKLYMNGQEAYSHSGVAFQVLHNTGEVTYEDIRIWNASMFVFQVNGNFGKLHWNNVKLEPKDADACPTVAWRDVVHAKDNRESLHFDRCVFGGSHDDIFNIANTLAQITEIGEENDLKIVGLDYAGGGFARIEEGDTAVILNPDEGIRCGEAKVVEVISQTTSSIRVRLDKSFDLDGGEYLYFKEMASPKTTITNCRLDGTFRIRAQATIENCTLNVLQMWTHYSGLTSEVEGPIPENITYRNCSFTHPTGTSNVFDFNCETKSGAVANFTVSSILFDGCTFQDDRMIREQPGVVLKDPKYLHIL